MTILAGLSPAGALIVRAGEPKVLNISLAQADGTTPQNLQGRTFALIVRRSSRLAPLFTFPAEISGDGLYVSVMLTAESATAVYEAGYAQALSYDIVELTGNASISRFTQRVQVETAPSLPSDIVPIWAMLPYTEAMIRPDALVISERGAAGDGTPALEAAATALEALAAVEGALDQVGGATAAAQGVVNAQAANLATVAQAVLVTGVDRAATQDAATQAGEAADAAAGSQATSQAAASTAISAANTSTTARDQVIAAADGLGIQIDPSQPTIPPSGTAIGSFYWAAIAGGEQLYRNVAGAGVAVSPAYIRAGQAALDAATTGAAASLITVVAGQATQAAQLVATQQIIANLVAFN